MPRIRTIKPEFWTSAQVLECSRNARLLFIGLWNFADDAGRHPDNAKQAKAEVFPADDLSVEDVQGMLDELSKNGLIRRYVIDGIGYFCITGWKHQRIDKPQDAKYPGPVDDHSKNDPGTLPPDRKGKDRIGKEESIGAPAPDPLDIPPSLDRRRGTRLPDDWTLPDTWRQWAKNERPGMDLDREAEKFRDYWIAQPGQKGSKTDWQATWRNWIRNAHGSDPPKKMAGF